MNLSKSFTMRAALIALSTLLIFGCTSEKQKAENTKTNPVDLVYPLLDTDNSRWFFFSSACRPFGMVNLSPDTQIGGAWGSGYLYATDTVKGFSHIHAWQLSGLSVMPVTLNDSSQNNIFKDFYSHFSHETEKVSPGYQSLELDRYKISAELTSTKRVGFHRYTFHGNGKPALLVNLNTILGPCRNMEGALKQIDNKTITGELTNAPTSRRPKPTKVFFELASDTKITRIVQDKETHNYLLIFDETAREVKLKAGISYTSVQNAVKMLFRM